MEIVEDFDKKFYNNNGKPWKSSGILHYTEDDQITEHVDRAESSGTVVTCSKGQRGVDKDEEDAINGKQKDNIREEVVAVLRQKRACKINTKIRSSAQRSVRSE